MTRQVTKEQAVFLAGAALFIWVMVKLMLFLAHQSHPPGNPTVAAPAPQPGDAAMRDLLATRGLDAYGGRDFFFPDASQPTQLFVRGLVSHSFLRTSLISRYTYECRMSPNAAREVRFQLPAGAKATDIFCKEMDEERKWGQDGRTLVVPVNPILLKRAYYRCQITIVMQGPFAASAAGTAWTAPAISCGDAMPNVACEVGCLTIAAPGDLYDIIAKEAPGSTLTRLALEGVPKELAATSNKLAFTYRQANYTLTLDIKAKHGDVAVARPTKGGTGIRPKGEPVLKPKGEPVIGPKGGDKGKEAQPKEEKPKLDIPKAADADALPFKLAAILRVHEPEPRRQAVLRNKESGEYLRKFEGDVVMDDLKINSITDDAVIIEDSKGKHYKFRGRFDDKY